MTSMGRAVANSHVKFLFEHVEPSAISLYYSIVQCRIPHPHWPSSHLERFAIALLTTIFRSKVINYFNRNSLERIHRQRSRFLAWNDVTVNNVIMNFIPMLKHFSAIAAHPSFRFQLAFFLLWWLFFPLFQWSTSKDESSSLQTSIIGHSPFESPGEHVSKTNHHRCRRRRWCVYCQNSPTPTPTVSILFLRMCQQVRAQNEMQMTWTCCSIE